MKLSGCNAKSVPDARVQCIVHSSGLCMGRRSLIHPLRLLGAGVHDELLGCGGKTWRWCARSLWWRRGCESVSRNMLSSH
ncbi:hypothetical protein GDO81_022764 [Engystomops pustulosus]|uniref:Uncharacterized protein n=1 Tax=Engystomops pustulosus TaxID=76066 RepID=A0AAV6YQN0_ENGPU|nr:hypothetical protein GDO81_022764 [Engystomops pustulosus]